MLKAVILDFGGVVSDSCWDPGEIAELIENVLNKYDLRPMGDLKSILESVSFGAYIARHKAEIEVPLIDIVNKALIDVNLFVDRDVLYEIMEVIREAPFCSIRPEAREVIMQLKEMGLKVGVVSNTSDVHPLRAMMKAGIYELLDAVVLSCWVTVRKPNPAIFKIALRRLNVSPDEAIYVGDIPEVDIVGAHRAGMKAVWIRDGEKYWKDKGIITLPDSIKPDFIIDNLHELIDVVLELKPKAATH
ncbi:MAG: HAD family hydrolase [Candidatus Njordarchaeia archaeon]